MILVVVTTSVFNTFKRQVQSAATQTVTVIRVTMRHRRNESMFNTHVHVFKRQLFVHQSRFGAVGWSTQPVTLNSHAIPDKPTFLATLASSIACVQRMDHHKPESYMSDWPCTCATYTACMYDHSLKSSWWTPVKHTKLSCKYDQHHHVASISEMILAINWNNIKSN